MTCSQKLQCFQALSRYPQVIIGIFIFLFFFSFFHLTELPQCTQLGVTLYVLHTLATLGTTQCYLITTVCEVAGGNGFAYAYDHLLEVTQH